MGMTTTVGAAAIVKASGARIAAHTNDAAYVANPTKLWLDLHRRFPRYHPKPTVERSAGSNVDLLLEDGMHIDLGPFEAEVVHTPGHTDGSICVYDRKGGCCSLATPFRGGGRRFSQGPHLWKHGGLCEFDEETESAGSGDDAT